jgi:DNA-binding FadR family transcriptional regulator
MARPSEKLYVPRAAEVVAARLRGRILNGELRDGDELPPEAQMLAEFGVSRPTLREALWILETEGLFHTRRGKRGGGVVHTPTPETAAYHVGLVLQLHQADLDDVASARAVLEPACAALAAERDDREALAGALDAAVDESEQLLESPAEFTQAALRFHEVLVSRSGNQTITLLVGILETIWGTHERRWAQTASDEGDYPEVALRRQVVKAHRRIAQLIRAGDAEGAARETRKHLAASQRFAATEGSRAVEVVGIRDGHRWF